MPHQAIHKIRVCSQQEHVGNTNATVHNRGIQSLGGLSPAQLAKTHLHLASIRAVLEIAAAPQEIWETCVFNLQAPAGSMPAAAPPLGLDPPTAIWLALLSATRPHAQTHASALIGATVQSLAMFALLYLGSVVVMLAVVLRQDGLRRMED